MNRVIIAAIFLALGTVIGSFMPVIAETRLATSQLYVPSTQRVPFNSISVYPDQAVIAVPGLRYAKVSSNSMAPIITDKSVVFEKTPTSPEEISINDVISFYEPSLDAIVLHLVTGIINENGKLHYKTKGLANPQEDPWIVPYANVRGIMIGTVR